MDRNVIVTFGIGFGDEGKGTIVDFLVREYGAEQVIRYCGGPQAAHNVVSPERVWHCFSQFGSGTLVPGTKTILTSRMVIEPENLLAEFEYLQRIGHGDALSRLSIDSNCAIVTPFNKMVCQMRNISEGGKFGSCGMGVGESIRDRSEGGALIIQDLLTGGKVLLRKLSNLHNIHRETAFRILRYYPGPEMQKTYDYFIKRTDFDSLMEIYRRVGRKISSCVIDCSARLAKDQLDGVRMVFEGAQGALLDRELGFDPYVTQSRSVWPDAAGLVESSDPDSVMKVGIMRAYGHRHGPGPFVTEDESLRKQFNDPRNPINRWQGPFRIGWLDLVSMDYGLRINDGAGMLALTGLDRLSGLKTIKICTGYRCIDDNGWIDGLDKYFSGRDPYISGIKDPRSVPDFCGSDRTKLLFKLKPVYEELPGWKNDISDAKSMRDLPFEAMDYIRFIQRWLNTQVRIVSVGPRSDQKFFIDMID